MLSRKEQVEEKRAEIAKYVNAGKMYFTIGQAYGRIEKVLADDFDVHLMILTEETDENNDLIKDENGETLQRRRIVTLSNFEYEWLGKRWEGSIFDRLMRYGEIGDKILTEQRDKLARVSNL